MSKDDSDEAKKMEGAFFRAESYPRTPQKRSLFFRNKVSGEPNQTKLPKRLSTSELQALFRRLDVNGDGELTFAEFRKIVIKLNMNSKNIEDILLDVFKSSDAAPGTKRGALSIDEFLQAYSVLYNRFLQDSGANEGGGGVDEKDETFVRATRYGYLGNDSSDDKRYVFEVYTGTIKCIDTLYIFDLPNVDDTKRDYAVAAAYHGDKNGINLFTIPQVYPAGKTLSGYTLSTLNRLILEDSERNRRTSSRVMWWVDVASRYNRSSDITAFVTAFGIPEEQKASLHHFGEDTSVLSSGSGEVVCEGLANSPAYLGRATVLSCFVQLLHVHNRPIVPRDPQWLQHVPLPFDIGTYLSSRLSVFYNFKGVKCYERAKLMHAAQAEGRDLLNHHNDTYLSTKHTNNTTNNNSDNHNTNDLHKVPLCETVALPKLPGAEAQYAHAFLLSAHDMNVRKPALGRQTLSLHLQDQGYGPCALLTYRSMDSELTRREAGEFNTNNNNSNTNNNNNKENNASSKDNQANNNNNPSSSSSGSGHASGYVAALGRHAQAGVLGRALQGVWLKLLEVMAHEGIANTCSELDDSPFALMMYLISAVHNLSLDTVQSLDAWHKRIVREVESIAVTKHGKHIEQLDLFVREISDYVTSFNSAMAFALETYGLPSDKHIARQARYQARKPVHVFTKDTWSPDYRRGAEEVYAATAHLASSDVVHSAVPSRQPSRAQLPPAQAHAVQPLHPSLFAANHSTANTNPTTSDVNGVRRFSRTSHSDHKAGAGGGGSGAGGARRQSVTMAAPRRASLLALPSQMMMTQKSAASLRQRNHLQKQRSRPRSHFGPRSARGGARGGVATARTRDSGESSDSEALHEDEDEVEDEDDDEEEDEEEVVNVLVHFATNGTAKLLPELLNGMPRLERKGSLYWLEQLQKLSTASDRLKERYQMSLDEKRNFWSLILSIVTIVTFPFAVMTGYFGMNFENMAEPGAVLTNDFFPAFPGQYTIWFLTLIIYSVMFLGMLHYEVIQSAM